MTIKKFDLISSLRQKAIFDVSKYAHMPTEQDVMEHICWKAAEELDKCKSCKVDSNAVRGD
jgi:hypothetical protein